jgi:hypothetical protein
LSDFVDANRDFPQKPKLESLNFGIRQDYQDSYVFHQHLSGSPMFNAPRGFF